MCRSPLPRESVSLSWNLAGLLRPVRVRRHSSVFEREGWAIGVPAGRHLERRDRRLDQVALTRVVAPHSLVVVARSVICISREMGSGGEEVGKLLAERLGYLYADGDVIVRAAARGGIDVERVLDEEKRRSLIAGLLSGLAAAGGSVDAMTGVHSLAADEPGGEAVRAFIREAIEEIAEHGKAVIVAHAASFAVGSRPDVLRVLIAASQETRSRRLAAADGLSAEAAVKAVKRSDADRADYLRRFYGVAAELPTHYDLIVNTDTLAPEQAAELVARMVSGTGADS
jgi:cytidylate kinase